MKSKAFIFARSGSKKLPKKNIKPLLGKPLIEYSIEVALQVVSIDNLFVSTDDKDIAQLSKSLGVNVIDRPSNLSQDDSPEWEAWQHAIFWVREKYGDFDQFISLPPTSPLRIKKDVEDAISKKNNLKADICIAVTPSSRNPFFNMVKIKENKVELVSETNNLISRRQDAPEVFDITTIVYVANVNFVMNNNNLFDGNITSIEVPKERSIDIDDIYDFNYAESVLKDKLKKNN